MKISHLISLNKNSSPSINTFSFTLPQSSTTSAGVYDTDGSLIRTLWSAEPYIAGTHVYQWDGLLDDRTIAPLGNYSVKVLSHNVQYSWDGARIGNSSTVLTGGSIYRGFQETNCIAVAGRKLFYANGYQEQANSQYVTDLDTLGTRARVVPGPGYGTNQVTTTICSDGTYVYWGGYQLNSDTSPKYFLVFATRVDNNAQVTFPQGMTIQATGLVTYSALAVTSSDGGYQSGPEKEITALAVQKTGNYLFVGRRGLDQLQVINKVTGEFIRSITIQNVSQLAVDTTNYLWIAAGSSVVKYMVNNDGTITSTGISITGVLEPSAIAVSPDNTTIIVSDNAVSRQWIKGYSNTDGSELWALGTPGGYSTDATVTNNKFYFHDVRASYPVSISFEENGSFWITEIPNNRVVHFSAARTYIEDIMYLQAMYQVNIVSNTTNRLVGTSGGYGGGAYLEFALDYTKELDNGKNGSWELVKNWGSQVPPAHDNLRKFMNTVQVHGKTFTTLTLSGQNILFELVFNGTIRQTKFLMYDKIIADDGTLVTFTGYSVGNNSTYWIYGFTGYDSDGDPTWSSTPSQIIHTPVMLQEDAITIPFKISNNKIFYFQGNTVLNNNEINYHLAALDIATSKWLFKTSPGTYPNYTGDFPAKGEFDNGNGVNQAGGFITVNGSNIVWTYRGEFWKAYNGYGQTNKFNHYHDSGLFVGQFGVLRDGNEGAYGAAGNAFTGSWVQDTSDRAFVYHGDEGQHGGYHRWRVEGLNSVNMQTCVFNSSVHYLPPPANFDLMSGISRTTALSQTFGWAVSHPNENGWLAAVGDKSASRYDDLDVWVRSSLEGYDDKIRFVSRTLGANTLQSWQLKGVVNFDDNSGAATDQGGYIQVLDHTGKVIVQMYETEPSQDAGIVDLKVNGSTLHRYEFGTASRHNIGNVKQSFSYTNNNGSLTVQYYNYTLTTTTVAEAGADASRPTTFRLYLTPSRFYPRNRQKSISISKLQFLIL